MLDDLPVHGSCGEESREEDRDGPQKRPRRDRDVTARAGTAMRPNLSCCLPAPAAGPPSAGTLCDCNVGTPPISHCLVSPGSIPFLLAQGVAVVPTAWSV